MPLVKLEESAPWTNVKEDDSMLKHDENEIINRQSEHKKPQWTLYYDVFSLFPSPQFQPIGWK